MVWEVDAISAMASSTTRMREKAKCNIYITFRKNKPLRGVLSMPLYSMKEGKDDERN